MAGVEADEESLLEDVPLEAALLELVLESDDAEESAVLALDDPPALLSPSFFVDEYKSLYQPPPFRWNALWEMMRSSLPPHASHSVFGSSLMRCMYSETLPQL